MRKEFADIKKAMSFAHENDGTVKAKYLRRGTVYHVVYGRDKTKEQPSVVERFKVFA